MSEPHVVTETIEQFCMITLSRTEKRNALTVEMMEEIAAHVQAAAMNPALRAVIVAANGPIFSAGMDLMAIMGFRQNADGVPMGRWLRSLAERLQRATNLIEGAETPVIGAINGKVMGMGLELILSFDLRVAADDALLSIPETRLGLIADVGGTTRLSRVVGPSRAKDLLMTARSIDAQEALQWGLVNRVVPAADLREGALNLAREIAKNAPLAVSLAKLVIDQGDGLDRFTQMAMERWAQSELIVSQDLGEAMAAFMEKRAASFQGK
jgi:enoyl-CoA hydratase/carnithine racemase